MWPITLIQSLCLKIGLKENHNRLEPTLREMRYLEQLGMRGASEIEENDPRPIATIRVVIHTGY